MKDQKDKKAPKDRRKYNDKLVQDTIYRVEVDRDFHVKNEKPMDNGFGILFETEREIFIVGMTAPAIYKMIGEKHIISMTKVNTPTFKKK